MSNLIEYARLYAERGWYVLPVAGKVPLTKNGLKDASVEMSTLELWWGIGGKVKESNIAIRTGAISGLVVVDIDRKAGGLESYEAMKDRFPPTPTVRTGGGGLHLYYKHMGTEVRNSASKIAPGIDIRGDNGYVVAPPSTHDSGSDYKWEVLPSEVELSAFPMEILPKDSTFDPTGLFTQGSKKTTTTQLAGHMRAIGAPINVIEAAVMAVDNGLTVKERQGIIESASKWPDPPPNRTEMGQAEFIATKFENCLAYDLSRETWLVWNGHQWKPQPTSAIFTYVKEGARDHIEIAKRIEDDKERKTYQDWQRSLESDRSMSAVTKILRLELAKTYKLDEEPYLFGTPNGVINLRDEQLLVGQPDQWVTRSANVEYNPEAKAPRWEQFIREIFADKNGVERPELVDWVHRAVGYSITGNRAYQCWFLCLGAGSNGKSTFLTTLKDILGDYAMNASVRSFIVDNRRSSISNDLAEMAGYRMVIAQEAGTNAELDSERIKALTSGLESIRARHLYKSEFEFKPVMKLWIANNHRPRVTDDSHGFWRRVRYIPFDRQFTEDTTLAETLENEHQGILAWCVRGASECIRRGLDEPAIVKEMTKDYQDSSDPLLAWFRDRLRLTPTGKLTLAEAYLSYMEWCSENSVPDRNRIGRYKVGEYLTMKFDKQHGQTGNYFTGVELK